MSLSDDQTPPAKQHRSLMLFFVSSVSCAGSALIAQQIYVARQQGFGAGDIWAFVFWLSGLSVVVGIVAVALAALRCRSWLRHTVYMIVGLVGGFVWTWFVAVSLGPWFGAFSFPVLYFWTLGAVVGLVFGSFYVSLCDRGGGKASAASSVETSEK